MSLKSFLRCKSHLLMCAVVLGFAAVMPQAQAQTAPAASKKADVAVLMAVLDSEGIYANSKAMKSIHEQFAKYQGEMQTSIDTEKQALQKEEEELNRKRTLLAPEVFAEERKKFQGRIVGLQRKVQETNQMLNQVRAKATAKVGDVLRTVVQEIVTSNGITIVFHKNQTVISDPGLDISQLVLAELDKRLPSVQVEKPVKK